MAIELRQFIFSKDGYKKLFCHICFPIMETRDSSLGEIGSVALFLEPRQACGSLGMIEWCGDDAV